MKTFVLQRTTLLLTSRRFIKCRSYASVTIPKPFNNLAEVQQYACTTYAAKKIFGVRAGKTFKWITYGEFGQMVDSVRSGLASLGVKQGDAIAVIANNRVEWAAVAYGAHGLGAHIVPMYEVQKPSEWSHIVKDSGAVVLFVANKGLITVGEGWLKDNNAPTALRNVICFEKGVPDIYCFQKFVEKGKATPVPPISPSPETLAAIIYTSGTTGIPKGVELTHRNITSNINGLHILCKELYSAEDVVLSFLPWAHVYGQTTELHHLVSVGAALGIATSPHHVIEELPLVKPNKLVAVPTMFNRIYASVLTQIARGSPLTKYIFKNALICAVKRREEYNKYPVGTTNPRASMITRMKYKFYDALIFKRIRKVFGGRLQYAFTGGAAIHQDIQEFFHDIGITIMEGYGLTETSPIIAIGNYCPTVHLQGGLGFFPGTELEIMDPNTTKFLPRGEEGEIIATGPNIMVRYHNLPEATHEAIFERDGKRYFRTGDMGIITPEGKLKITGRVKELYKLENGKWVAPVTTENTIMKSPYLQQVMMYGANRPYNVLLVTPHTGNIKKRLNLKSVNVNDPKVVRLIVDNIRNKIVKSNIRKYEAPMRVLILPEDEITVASGLLTPKMSVKRPLVFKKYEQEINQMYQGRIGYTIKLK